MDPIRLQQTITLIAAGLIALPVVGGLALVVGEIRMRSRRRTRLTNATPVVRDDLDATLSGTVKAGIQRLGQQSAVRDPAQLSVVRMKLMRAGYFNRDAATVYLGARALALILATAATVILLPFVMGGGGMKAVLLAVVLSAAAVLAPDQVLSLRRQARELEYTEGFPDLLDLLVASVEAGLSLDAAVTRVGEELSRRYVHLGEHLRFLTLELRAGRSRRDAWSSFAERLGIDDARALATMLRQSEEMGTSLGDTLTVFSEDMRAKRMLRAEEKAMSLPAKLMVPLILFIFPCLMGVLILPAAYRISQTLMAN